MPDFAPYTLRQLDRALETIEQNVYQVVAPLDIRAWCSREPFSFPERYGGVERELRIGDRWGELFNCAWFRFTGQVPRDAAGRHIVLLLDVNGEMCVVDAQGVPLCGLTNGSSVFDMRLGKPGKRVIEVVSRAEGGEAIDFWADAGCNDLFGNLQEGGAIKQAWVAVCDDHVRALYYDFEVLLDFLKVLPIETARYRQILVGLHDVTAMLPAGVEAVARRARERLAPLLAQRGGDPTLRISAVGHAHMDLAWLWPIRETIRKGARTFATALTLIERYPDYVFGASQPQYFLWMRERYPELYARIKQRVAEGRIEPQGAMWVEADVNISGGEALVRQLLYGKRYFRDEFGVDPRYLWLPDVFGYSAALPQILRLAGIDYFSTQKLSWSKINTFPHHSFHWQGIDGSTVLAHMLPEETYNSPAAPRSAAKIERNYREGGVSGHALMVFGIGDGGGGPGEEHLERLGRIQNLAGLSPVRQQSAAAFFEEWRCDAQRFPTWVGELYLECHQGTLTSQARVKWYNRKLELALRELEWTAAIDSVLANGLYPAARLEAIWQEALLYQFHDILPGSSIKRVYDECLPRYAELLRDVTEQTVAHEAHLAEHINTSGMQRAAIVRNSLAWERAEWVRVDGQWAYVSVPPLGYTTVDTASSAGAIPALVATARGLENDLLRVEFDENGSIRSIYDKRTGRELVPAGQRANCLAVYTDTGDAWDFPLDYADQPPRQLSCASAAALVDGPRAQITQVYQIGGSELVQRIVLMAGSARIEFQTTVRWREPRTMLRTSFPVAIQAEAATYDIQFGHIRRPTHRNTTWDLARDEVAAHKWVDLSQRDYGVALLNDSKYGHKVKGNVIDLNLLRSVPYPGPRITAESSGVADGADEGVSDLAEHSFVYALYPHLGDHVEGRVVQAGYALNVPLRVLEISAHPGDLPPTSAMMVVDAPNIVVEAVKLAEGNPDLIVRLYEAEQRGATAAVRFAFPIAAAAEVNLLEERICPIAVAENAVTLVFRPFEIKTLRVKTGSDSD